MDAHEYRTLLEDQAKQLGLLYRDWQSIRAGEVEAVLERVERRLRWGYLAASVSISISVVMLWYSDGLMRALFLLQGALPVVFLVMGHHHVRKTASSIRLLQTMFRGATARGEVTVAPAS